MGEERVTCYMCYIGTEGWIGFVVEAMKWLNIITATVDYFCG